MLQEAKSERSRRQVLDSALQLFSHQGYRATSVREIADKSGISTGNLYHHFPDKEAIFNTLLDELWTVTDTRRFPYRRALMNGDFPDNLEALGFAARDSVREFKDYMALVYVDVIEFEGAHVQKFYTGMGARLTDAVSNGANLASAARQLRIAPVSALLLTTRLFFGYFMLEVLLNVPEPFGKDSRAVVREIADILRNGILI